MPPPPAGWPPVRRATETLIAYATDPGEVAADGSGRNSPFTAALLEHLGTPGLSLNDVLTRVKRSVRQRTNDRQRPWTLDSLSSIFYFRPGVASPRPNPVPSDPSDPDPAAEMWKVVRDSEDRDLVTDFLERHPNSAYAGAAQALLRRLSALPFTVETVPPGAAVRILNVNARYTPGMRLNPGEYRVEASADGHRTRVATLTHGGDRTTHSIVLEQLHQVGDTFRDALASGGDGPLMVVLPSGSFLMGSPAGEEGRDEDEGSQHRVTIGQPFALGGVRGDVRRMGGVRLRLAAATVTARQMKDGAAATDR